eukprot:scaffold263642_cov21-Tisochrysis_lutea.AAC.1
MQWCLEFIKNLRHSADPSADAPHSMPHNGTDICLQELKERQFEAYCQFLHQVVIPPCTLGVTRHHIAHAKFPPCLFTKAGLCRSHALFDFDRKISQCHNRRMERQWKLCGHHLKCYQAA